MLVLIGHAGLAVSVGVFLARMIHNAVLRQTRCQGADSGCASSVIRWLSRAMFSRTIGAICFLGRCLDMERASRAAALNEGEDGVLMVRPSALDLDAFLAADKGFVDLDDAASAAHGRKFASRA